MTISHRITQPQHRYGLLIVTHWTLPTVSKGLSNIVLDFYYVAPTDFGRVHELTLVGAAGQLTKEVHQVEEAGRTPVHRCNFK